MRIKKSLAKLVEWERVCRVATVSRHRVPHVVPVCHVVLGGKLYFGSEKTAQKVLNLRSNPNVAVTVDLYSDDWSNLKGVMIQGTVAFIEKGLRFRHIRKALYSKYPQYPDQAALAEADSVIMEVTPRNVFSWGIE
jgi:nitroimidazol reductase NimA-like FMN-containing flavoprotein (pyridoxamine 5'-phosphate oxidase superfamily)